MTMPGSEYSGDGTQAQILLKLGEISTQLAVVTKVLEAIPDHEQRIRQVEHTLAESSGGRDTWARVVGGLAAAGAVASGWVNFVHR